MQHYMHVQTIASVGYQRKFHKATGMLSSRLVFFAGPHLVYHWSPESGVDCPCPWFHANSLCCPAANCLSAGSRRQLFFASSYHFRIRRDFRSKNPLSGFASKQTKESSALAAHPYSATHIPFVSEVKFQFLHISQLITLPTLSCLALYSLCANLLHSLITWLMVSSLSSHSLHLLFCWVLSILALIWLVLTALSCAFIWRDSVSLLKFPFFRHVQVFSCEILFISHLNCPQSCFLFHFCFLVLSIVSGVCNESSFVFLYIVFGSFYRCVNAIFNAGKPSSSLFSWNI